MYADFQLFSMNWSVSRTPYNQSHTEMSFMVLDFILGDGVILVITGYIYI